MSKTINLPSKYDESILAIHRNEMFENGALLFQGINTDPIITKRISENLENCRVFRRGDVEDDFTLKQPITFTVIKRGSSIFTYKRLNGGGESRLHDSLSIGVGGHMNVLDGVRDWEATTRYNINKEINEELHASIINRSFGSPYGEIQYIGLINDDSNDVGRAHLGLYSIIEISDKSDVWVKEVDTLEGSWIDIRDFIHNKKLTEGLESWSKLIIDDLISRYGYDHDVYMNSGADNPLWDVLGFTPYQSQLDYIFLGEPMGKERRSGRTTAHIIKLCISTGSPLDINRPWTFSDRDSRLYAMSHYLPEFLEIYGKLKDAGIPVRELVMGRGL